MEKESVSSHFYIHADRQGADLIWDDSYYRHLLGWHCWLHRCFPASHRCRFCLWRQYILDLRGFKPPIVSRRTGWQLCQCLLMGSTRSLLSPSAGPPCTLNDPNQFKPPPPVPPNGVVRCHDEAEPPVCFRRMRAFCTVHAVLRAWGHHL